MKPIFVKCPRSILERFKADARAAFPHEKYALLIGHNEPRGVVVTELYYPDGVDHFCSTGRVDIQPIWFVDAEEYAKDIGADLVGDIHSHAYTHDLTDGAGHEQSEADFDATPEWHKVAGICRVTQSRSGRLRASVRFWGPIIPVVLRVV